MSVDLTIVDVEHYLKELSERGYNILWEYDSVLNSMSFTIWFQEPGGLIHKMHRLIPFSVVRDNGASNSTIDFVIVRILEDMVAEFESEMKGKKQ